MIRWTATRTRDFLDIVPPACTKGTGLQHLVEYLQSEHPGSSYEVHTIGDSWNDIDMHRYADRSASFNYSPMRLRLSPPIVWIRRTSLLRLPCRSCRGGVQAQRALSLPATSADSPLPCACSPPTPPFHVKHPLSRYSPCIPVRFLCQPRSTPKEPVRQESVQQAISLRRARRPILPQSHDPSSFSDTLPRYGANRS